MESRKNSADIYNMLRNPLRRRILELLYERGEMSASELKRELNISMGTLYYHLDILSPFIRQTMARKYCLSDAGRRAISIYLTDDMTSMENVGGMGVGEKITLAHVLNMFSSHPFMCITSAVLIAALYILLMLSNGIRPFVLFFIPGGGSVLNDVLWSIGNLLFLVVYFFLAASLFSKIGRIGREILLLPPLIIIANIPTVIFLTYLWLIVKGMVTTFIPVRVIYLIFAIWQLFVYASALNILGINWDRALLSSLILSYINLLILYVFGYTPF